MKSRFDYPDPGEDPEYCAGLEAKDEQPSLCLWCSTPYMSPMYGPYCSRLCAIDAEEHEP